MFNMKPQEQFLYFSQDVVKGIQEREAAERRRKVVSKVIKTAMVAGIALPIITGVSIKAYNMVFTGIRHAAAQAEKTLDKLLTPEYLPGGRIKFGSEIYCTKEVDSNDELWRVVRKEVPGASEDLKVLAKILNKNNKGPWIVPTYCK